MQKIKSFMENMRFYGETLSSYSLNITDLTSIEEEINFCIKARIRLKQSICIFQR